MLQTYGTYIPFRPFVCLSHEGTLSRPYLFPSSRFPLCPFEAAASVVPSRGYPTILRFHINLPLDPFILSKARLKKSGMVKPIPDNVKTCLAELTAAQQVTLRGYIGSLRAEIKGLEEEVRTINDPDPHAHYHGHEKCTGKSNLL